jgi:hypothetical protein
MPSRKTVSPPTRRGDAAASFAGASSPSTKLDGEATGAELLGEGSPLLDRVGDGAGETLRRRVQDSLAHGRRGRVSDDQRALESPGELDRNRGSRAAAARDQRLRLLLDQATKLRRRQMGLGARGREQPPDSPGNSGDPRPGRGRCRPALVTRPRSSSLVAAGASATSTSASTARRARKLAPWRRSHGAPPAVPRAPRTQCPLSAPGAQTRPDRVDLELAAPTCGRWAGNAHERDFCFATEPSALLFTRAVRRSAPDLRLRPPWRRLAAQELGSLNLAEALDLTLLMREQARSRYERAALRWLERFIQQRQPTITECPTRQTMNEGYSMHTMHARRRSCLPLARRQALGNPRPGLVPRSRGAEETSTFGGAP